MLTFNQVIAVIPASNIERARGFYEGTLGLRVRAVLTNAVQYEIGQTRLIVYVSPYAGTAQSTAAALSVSNILETMTELRNRGVIFEEYDLPGVKTTDGLAETDGRSVAWFKDTEGNILEINQGQ